ncbi:hypothetical protein, partial [Gimesia panareensis]
MRRDSPWTNRGRNCIEVAMTLISDLLAVSDEKRLFCAITMLPAVTTDRETFVFSNFCSAALALFEGENIDRGLVCARVCII